MLKICDDHCITNYRRANQGKNTLDLVFTNEVSLINDIEVNKSNKSDHSRIEISTNFIMKEENMQNPHNKKNISKMQTSMKAKLTGIQ